MTGIPGKAVRGTTTRQVFGWPVSPPVSPDTAGGDLSENRMAMCGIGIGRDSNRTGIIWISAKEEAPIVRFACDFVLLVLAVVIPLAAWVGLPFVPPLKELPLTALGGGSHYLPSPVLFDRRPIGAEDDSRPLIANVQIVDFDRDGLVDVIACDAKRQRVVWHRQGPPGEFAGQTLAEDLPAPAHATVVDLDGDGDSDVLVSVLGDILPNDGVIGRL
ncbi:MAG: VCBS repeat-containing protein, partial [Planctomycetaceae bacterium]